MTFLYILAENSTYSTFWCSDNNDLLTVSDKLFRFCLCLVCIFLTWLYLCLLVGESRGKWVLVSVSLCMFSFVLVIMLILCLWRDASSDHILWLLERATHRARFIPYILHYQLFEWESCVWYYIQGNERWAIHVHFIYHHISATTQSCSLRYPNQYQLLIALYILKLHTNPDRPSSAISQFVTVVESASRQRLLCHVDFTKSQTLF